MRVYLCGGMRDNWRSVVKDQMDAIWIDPIEHGFTNPSLYTPWDLAGVRNCDVLFAYMDKENPSGFGLMLEIGYAKGLGKTVIFADEQQHRYMQIAAYSVDFYCATLDQGVHFLNKLKLIY